MCCLHIEWIFSRFLRNVQRRYRPCLCNKWKHREPQCGNWETTDQEVSMQMMMIMMMIMVMIMMMMMMIMIMMMMMMMMMTWPILHHLLFGDSENWRHFEVPCWIHVPKKNIRLVSWHGWEIYDRFYYYPFIMIISILYLIYYILHFTTIS